MRSFSIFDAALAAGGRYVGPEELKETMITGVVIDNRKVTGGELFVALKGERFDAHQFIPAAMAAGAACALSAKPLEAHVPHILVEDTQAAFQKLAGWYKAGFGVKTVGITGSVGKTTTKEMVAAVLEQSFCTLKSAGNLNNQTGVPQNLLRLEEQHQAAVIEMGTNHFGEIDSLAAMVRPDICLYTNIGDSHIEFLGSREGILQAKCEMLPHMQPGGTVVVNGDDALLVTLKEKRSDVITYGTAAHCDLRAENIRPMGLEGSAFCVEGKEYFVPAPGSHMVLNALAAMAVGRIFGMDDEAIKAGIAAYQPISGRMVIEKSDKLTVLNDVYNANPSSVKSSLSTLAYADGRRVAVLGDMLELGEKSEDYHRQVGEYAKEQGIHLLLAVGPLSAATAKAAGDIALHFETQEQLLEKLGALILPGDTVLVKASRGMHLELTAEALMKL
ncbi:MAG: UDP-N-acetylmuramoyl-tripeptide--D-alanyl-D-alanine ligase [Christensenellaceae bacterium]|nr:UDP-N-acetylmuramoyl-tripeptide--D-alanyl-D-alanine ligase [Christensenellaceae bacterium]